MDAMTVREAEQNLERLISRVVADAEPTIVVSETGEQVVVLSLDEYNSWKETLYLLANPANAAHLRDSIAEKERLFGHMTVAELAAAIRQTKLTVAHPHPCSCSCGARLRRADGAPATSTGRTENQSIPARASSMAKYTMAVWNSSCYWDKFKNSSDLPCALEFSPTK